MLVALKKHVVPWVQQGGRGLCIRQNQEPSFLPVLRTKPDDP